MKHWRYLTISTLVILLHQLAQTWVYDLIEAHGGHITVLPFFNLVEVWNPGISFGMFQGLMHGEWVLSSIAIIITAILLRWFLRSDHPFTLTALALIIGGAVGNTIDRLRFGKVADYLDFHAFGYHWPAFNLTDSAIFIGVMLLLLPPRSPANKEAG